MAIHKIEIQDHNSNTFLPYTDASIVAMKTYAIGSSAKITTDDTVEIAIGKLESKVDGKAASSHTHSYAGSSSAGGAATSALACTGNSATATKATQDSAGQQINTTYIKGISASGKTITLTKGDGTQSTITTQDTDTHYTTGLKVGASSVATADAAATNGNVYLNVLDNTTIRDSHKITGAGSTSVTSDASGNITITSTNTTYGTGTATSSGLTKLYTTTGVATDGTITQAVITKELEGKSDATHTHYYAGSSTVGGVATSALKLNTARKIAVTGAITGSGTFDGSGDLTITATSNHSHANDTITSLDASKLTGMISIDRLPQGALERCVVVANDTARFALTASDVQLGDTVKVTATEKMYFVVNASSLNSELGYEVYTAGSATTVPWSGVTGKPSTMANPYTLTIQGNGTGLGTYNGASAQTINITPANIGAATSGHTHNYAASSTAGGAATKAIQDNSGQQIDTTYIKNLTVSGKVVTYTRGDGTTGTITTQDTNTTYATGNTTTLGLTKLYTSTGTAVDGTMTQAAINTALDGKSATSHTHSYLPLSGGTVTGVVAVTNSTASTSKTTGAVKVSGGMGVAGQVSADSLMLNDKVTLAYDPTLKCISFNFA